MPVEEQLVVISSNDDDMMELSVEPAFTSLLAGGSGYKASCVYKGLVDLFVYTTDNCYKWDTCASQSILMSLGGGICSFDALYKDFGESAGVGGCNCSFSFFRVF